MLHGGHARCLFIPFLEVVPMRRMTILVALAVAFAASTTEAAKPTSKPTVSKPTTTKTQPPKGGAPKTTTTKVSVPKGPNTKISVGKVSHGKSPKTTTSGSSLAKGSSTKSTKTKASLAKSSTGSAKADTKVAKAKATTTKGEQSKKKTSALASTSTSTDGTSRTSTSGTTSTSGPATTIDFTGTDVGQKLQKNGALRSKIEAKLQAAGYTGTVYEAAYGFKNLGQLNAATNMVQNHGYDFDLLKLLMTGKYVDPETHTVYRAQTSLDGTVTLVKPELATSPTMTLSLGQAKQAIVAGAEMPELPTSTTTTTTTTSATKKPR